MICGTRIVLKTPPATSRKIRFGRLFALTNVSVTVEPRPRAKTRSSERRKPSTRESSVPTAMIALDLASDAAPALDAITRPSLQQMLGENLPGQVRDTTLIGEGQAARELRDGNPRDIDGLLIRVVLDGQLAADGLEQVVVHRLVDAVARDRE